MGVKSDVIREKEMSSASSQTFADAVRKSTTEPVLFKRFSHVKPECDLVIQQKSLTIIHEIKLHKTFTPLTTPELLQ